MPINGLPPSIKTSIPAKKTGTGTAPVNIALCKYWGKRDATLNLPNTSSLSIALPNKTTHTSIKPNQKPHDSLQLNGKLVNPESEFYKKAVAYLDLFRPPGMCFDLDTQSTIPIAAGLASSASGFAALARALDDLFDWQLPEDELSIIARLGSGSASRSLWNGFVEWHAGQQTDGLDSLATPINTSWPELRIGLLIFTEQVKPISSREAMKCTVETSTLYQSWPTQVNQDLKCIKHAIANHDFLLLGETSENNAMAMHATMLAAKPSICYHTVETLKTMQQIWKLRLEELPIYFTQDAGPNLKLLFLENDTATIQAAFPNIEIICPF